MDNVNLIAALWIGLALIASLASIRLGISVALIEIGLGVVGGNVLGLQSTPWIDFLAKDAAIRSNTSVCLKVTDPALTSLSEDAQAEFSKKLVALVEKEGAGYDFAYYRDAPAGLRIWCGATVEAKDVELLTQWIDWAFAETKAQLAKAA